MTTHSILSPSSSSRWLKCADSAHIAMKAPRTSNEYADEGTAAHGLLELCLKLDATPDQFANATMHDKYTVTEEMAEAVEHALEYIQAWLVKNPDGKVYIEHGIHWGKTLKLKPEVSSGTTDVMLVSKRSCVLLDYKHGAGVPVSPEENTQLMLYTYGAANEEAKHIDDFVLCIVQPRARHIEGPVREWPITRKALESWAKRTVAPKANKILGGSHERVAGDHCRWCSAQGSCRALKEYAMQAAKFDFEDAGSMTDDLSAQELGEVLAVLPLIESWAKAVYGNALEMLRKDGTSIEGWKLVAGRASPRQWLDKDKVMARAKKAKLNIDTYAPRELLTPAQMEKLVQYKGKKGKAAFLTAFGALCARNPAGPHIAPASDPRASYSEFDKVA